MLFIRQLFQVNDVPIQYFTNIVIFIANADNVLNKAKVYNVRTIHIPAE